MTWNIAVEALMNSKETKEICRRLDSSSTAFALPIKGGKVISFTENRSFAYVIILGNHIEMQEASCYF